MDSFAATMFISVFLGLIPASIAGSKGRNFLLWWLYGFVLFLIAMIHSILIKPTDESILRNDHMRKCPFCAEPIKSEATVCRYCGKDSPAEKPSLAEPKIILSRQWWK